MQDNDNPPSPLHWDIFCQVIDNFGDIGVCWRLARDLASRGHSVRLWIDDPGALAWMAPGKASGVRVMKWSDPLSIGPGWLEDRPVEVLVEAFGCNIPTEFLEACAQAAHATGLQPVWINLEYLSAEPYVERNHALPSSVFTGPAAGWRKWFFYPGFTEKTGGLLREQNLLTRRENFNAQTWLEKQGLLNPMNRQEKRIALFCYEPPTLRPLIQQFVENGLDGVPVRLLVTPGRPAGAVQSLLQTLAAENHFPNPQSTSDWQHGSLAITWLPYFSQEDFDHLLWSSDLNFVRGEDSVIRAIWAGKPFVWQIYPQDDGVHTLKLDAFLDQLEAPPSIRAFHHAWNGAADGDTLPDLAQALPDWSTAVKAARVRLEAQQDLGSSLVNFVLKNR